MDKTGDPLVSVIIPVFNDEAKLKLCLEALAHQTYAHSCFEVIVVDNGCDAPDAVQALLAAYGDMVLAHESIPGSYAARNRGIALARGEIIAFTDADCIPAPDWIERGVSRLQTLDHWGMVVGNVEVFPKNIRCPTLVESFQMVTGFPQAQHLEQFKGGATANVFTHRQVIDHVGPFNQTLKSFGDFEWGNRVFSAGYDQVYAAEVTVRHPARRTWQDLRQRTERAAGGVYDYFIQPQDTWIKRNKTFARLIVDDLMPPINFAMHSFTHPQLSTLKQRLGVPLVLLGVRYTSALEKIRLRLGGVSKRA